jgi:hypothetical protein
MSMSVVLIGHNNEEIPLMRGSALENPATTVGRVWEIPEEDSHAAEELPLPTTKQCDVPTPVSTLVNSPKKYNEITDAPFHECPRYERCSINHCPLDPLWHGRVSLRDDPEPGPCTLPRKRRMKIAAGHASLLPWRGMYTRELLAVQRWEALGPEEQERRKEALRAARPSKEESLEFLASARKPKKTP